MQDRIQDAEVRALEADARAMEQRDAEEARLSAQDTPDQAEDDAPDDAAATEAATETETTDQDPPEDPPENPDAPPPDAQASPFSAARMVTLAQQGSWLREHAGIDMLRTLRGNPGLAAQVSAGSLDMYQAHAQLMAAHAASAPVAPSPAPTAPPLVRGGGRRAAPDMATMPQQDFDRIAQRLARGERVAVE